MIANDAMIIGDTLGTMTIITTIAKRTTKMDGI
jgi:hypothetical protein